MIQYSAVLQVLAFILFSYLREAGAGVNRLSYFLAGNVSQFPQIAVMPIIYLSLQYTFTAPRGNILSLLY